MNNVNKNSIVFDIILFLITGGLWTFWMQYRQMRDVNVLLGENKYSFLMWLFLFIITFSLYHIIHEYRMTKDVLLVNGHKDVALLSFMFACISFGGLWIVTDLFQQSLINEKAN